MPKRYVPFIVGLIAFAGAMAVIVGIEGWWRYFIAVPLLAFGWVSLKTAVSAKDSDIRELTGDAPMSEGAAKRFKDRL